MAENWGLPSLIVALCAITLTLSPVSLSFIASIISPVLSTIWPSLGRCETFEWTHIPDGPLHTCSYPPQSCSHIGVHDATQSWENAVTKFFTIRRGNFVRKPKQLSLSTTYIRTDTKTLKAFLSLLNTRKTLSAFNLGEEPFRIVFKPVGGLTTAYFQIRHGLLTDLNRNYRLNVTKHEMELILQGYPPWYQNPLSLGSGRHVPHPIVDESDLSRGGWMVAVGLSTTRPVTQDFLENRDGSVLIVVRALDRVIRCLDHFEWAFPEEPRVSTARNLVKRVRASNGRGFGYSGSHLLKLFRQAGFGNLVGNRNQPTFSDGLTDRQVITAMKVFNYNEPLTAEEITQLRPVLDSVLQASMLGVFKVVKHIYVTGERPDRPCRLPPELENDGFVYVRERWEPLED